MATTPLAYDREKVHLFFRPSAALQRHFGAVLRVDGYGRRRLLINLEDLTGRAWFQARAHGIVSPLDVVAVPAGNGYLILKHPGDRGVSAFGERTAGAFIGTVNVGGQTKHVQFTHQRLQAPQQQDGQQASDRNTFYMTVSFGSLAPSNGTTTCTGPATVSAVGTGPHQAPYTGHTGSLYPPIAGGAMGTVAVQNDFLGIGRAGLRRYGTQISVSFADNGAIVGSGGPSGPYTVSDRGDIHIQNDPSVRFDLYRWDSTQHALQFGIHHYTGTVTFPTASGGTCPPGWTVPQ